MLSTRKRSVSVQKGFSLVELMVSLAIFSIVMTTAIGTLVVMIDANAKSQALYSAMTNLSFALDSITRHIRTGNTYHCASWNDQSIDDYLDGSNVISHDCAGGHTAIAFTRNIDGKRIGYRLNGAGIEQRIESGSWIPITSGAQQSGLTVDIQTFNIVVDNTDTTSGGDLVQPNVSLLVAGEVTNGLDTPTAFRLQSNVTPRILDY